MAAGGDEVAGDDGIGGGDVREVEGGDWVEAEGLSGAGGEEFEIWEVGFLDEALFSDDSVKFFGGGLEDLGLV